MKKITKRSKEKAKSNALKSFIPCQQKMCSLKGDKCPVCVECGAEPNLVSEGCQLCFDCEYKPNTIRDGRSKDNRLDEAIKNFEEALNKLNDKNKQIIVKQR